MRTICWLTATSITTVLAGRREPWLVIDPKVVVGDPEYQIAQLLWWRYGEIEDGALRRCFDAWVGAADADVGTAQAGTVVARSTTGYGTCQRPGRRSHQVRGDRDS